MTIGGWITMTVSLAVVWVGTFWCFRRVLTGKGNEKSPPGFGP